MTSIGTRGITLLAGLAAIAIGAGFLFGAPAEVAGAAVIAFAAAVSVATTRNLAAQASSHAHADRRIAASPRVEELDRIDRSLAAALESESGVEQELRPLLRPIASVRLARRGVDLDAHAAEARALLGDELWELVRANRTRSTGYAGGVSTARLRTFIERLEQT